MLEKFILKFNHLSDHNKEETKEDDNPNEMNNIPEILRIEGNIFDFETPLCEAYHELSCLLKIDTSLFTYDIQNFKTYDEYEQELNNVKAKSTDEPWWYDELADGKLKDETLTIKTKIEGSWGDAKPGVLKFCEWLKSCFENFHEIEYKVVCSRGVETRKVVSRTVHGALTEDKKVSVVKNGKDSLEICRVVNGMWQTSGGWGKIDRDNAVDAMLQYADAGLTTFDMADIYQLLTATYGFWCVLPIFYVADGPAEDLYGLFINRVRRERPPEFLENVKGLTKWVPPPVKMTSTYVRQNIDISRKRMDVASLDMLQFHWWDYSNNGYLDALKHLTDLKEEGKIKTVALTNFDTQRLQIILENGIPIVSNQVQHSLVDMRPQQRMAELCQLTGAKTHNVCLSLSGTYGTVMGGLLSEKFLDTNLSIPFAGPPLNTPSLQKYKRMVDAWGGWSLFQALLKTLNQLFAVKFVLDQPSVAGSMVGVRLGLSEHIKDCTAIFSLKLDEEDVNSIQEVISKGKDLQRVIGDCGDEYRRA
ncbi:flagellar radial spoke protein 5 isoform X2 [Tanacetum coccineum]|uniref:Flagellar radial spoke protein 5 isoform X2 n=1 Tax=Tanacetum coccineum TaxID=301880 RepID=A0ABQ5CIT4_9ASTR